MAAESQSRARIGWIDMVKCICMIFVVASHSVAKAGWLTAFYTGFFLSGFCFVSGYCYKPVASFGEFLRKKGYQLLIPWLIYGNFNIITGMDRSAGWEPILEKMVRNLAQISGNGAQLWFIPALFAAYIPTWLLIRWLEKLCADGMPRRKATIIVLGVSLVLATSGALYERLMNPELLPWKSVYLPWSLNCIFQFCHLMMLGYAYKTVFENKEAAVTVPKICIAVGLQAAVSVIAFFWPQMPVIPDTVFYFLRRYAGLCFIVTMAKVLPYWKPAALIGQNTLLIFAFHGKIMNPIQRTVEKFAGSLYTMILGTPALAGGFAILVGAATCLIILLPAAVINRYLPFTVGRKMRKK